MIRQDKPTDRYRSMGRVWLIPTREIRMADTPLRREMGYDKLLELAQSIAENGMLHPLLITFENGVPLLVAGHRRLKAAKMVGLREVPCLLSHADRLQTATIAMVENLQREDLHYFDVAVGIRNLIRRFQLTQEEVAGILGCSQPAVANKLRLLKLSEREQAILRENGCSERHARALLRIDNEREREEMLHQMVKSGWSIAKTEQMTSRPTLMDKPKTYPPAPLVRDMRLFINTINHAVDTMRQSGIDAKIEQTERDGFMELIVRIPKPAAKQPA